MWPAEAGVETTGGHGRGSGLSQPAMPSNGSIWRNSQICSVGTFYCGCIVEGDLEEDGEGVWDVLGEGGFWFRAGWG